MNLLLNFNHQLKNTQRPIKKWLLYSPLKKELKLNNLQLIFKPKKLPFKDFKPLPIHNSLKKEKSLMKPKKKLIKLKIN